MKKHTFILLLSALLGHFAHAQDYYGSNYSDKKVSLGITFSPNIHWLRYGDLQNIKKEPKIGYSYGLLGDFALTENYYFSTGFLINNLKASSDYLSENANNDVLATYHLQYIEVPFGLKLQSTQRYYRSYYGQFGFAAGIKINGERELSGADKTSLGNNAEPLRLAMQIGGGINWQLDHKLNMMTGLTLNNGFTGILKDGKPKSSYVAFNFAIFF
jgi:hypothetical protein